MGLTFPHSPTDRATSTDPHLRAIEMRTGLPREIWAHVVVQLTTLKACSLLAGTSLYLVTLPWAIHGAIQYLASALGCGITVTVLPSTRHSLLRKRRRCL